MSRSYRIPLSMADQLEALCKQHDVNETALVKDFITTGLAALAARK